MKGVSWKEARNPCSRCHCAPCQCERGVVSKDSWKSRYEAKNAPKKKAVQKKTAKAEPEMSKAKFIKELRKKNPSISDAEIKKKLKAAGYRVGCLVVAFLVLSPVGGLVWGIVEALW